MAVTHLTKSF